MTENNIIYDEIISAKRTLSDSESLNVSDLYFLKKMLHQNWKKGVALATVIFSGENSKKSFFLPRTCECIKNYRKVEKMLKKGEPLRQTIIKDDYEKVLASFTLNEIKFSKKKAYRIISKTSYYPEENYMDADRYWHRAELPYFVVENEVLLRRKFPAFGGPRVFSHKKEAVKAAQKWVNEILPSSLENVLEPQTEWSSKTAFKSVRYYCTETESIAVNQCVGALQIHKPDKDYEIDIIVFECIDDSRVFWREE